MKTLPQLVELEPNFRKGISQLYSRNYEGRMNKKKLNFRIFKLINQKDEKLKQNSSCRKECVRR